MSPAARPRWLLPTLQGARQSIATDLIAGITLAAIAIPGSMGAAQLVGVSPAVGLTGFLAGVVVFALIGGHRTLSVGPDSSIAPLLASGVAVGTVGTVGTGVAGTNDSDGASALLLISLMVAGFLILIGLLKGGWITQFLSRPVTTGLLAGVGISIIVSQLDSALGLEPTDGSVPREIMQLIGHLEGINPWAALLSVLVLSISIGARWINRRLPGALIGLIVAALVTAIFGLTERGVATLEEIDTVFKLPDFDAIPWSTMPELIVPALVIVVLITVQTGATESWTKQGQATLDRDLGAIGVASAVSAALGSFALNASPPRTRYVITARGRSQLAGLMAAVVVLAVLLFGTRLLPLLPQAALAAVLLQIAGSLIRIGELRRILRYSRPEFGIAIITAVLVCLFGIAEGAAIAALLTLLDRTRREARPPTYRKGLIPQSNHWVPVDAGVDTVQVPGVLVWSVEAPLWYADADFVTERLHDELDGDNGPYDVVVLDAAAISDLDYTGVLAFRTVIDHLEEEEIPFLLARATRPVQEALERSQLKPRVGMYPTVSDAVKRGTKIAGLAEEFRAARGKKKDLQALDEAGLNREELLGEDYDPGTVQ